MITVKEISEHIDKKFLTDEIKFQIISTENYLKCLKENQSKIIDIDRSYIHKFVKVGNYLKSFQKNILSEIEKIKRNDFKSNEFIDFGLLIEESNIPYELAAVKLVMDSLGLEVNQAKTYFSENKNSIIENGGIYKSIEISEIEEQEILKRLNINLLFYETSILNSFNMIKTIENDDMVSFYQIYESFDELGIFDSNWQKDMIEKMNELKSSIEMVTNSLNEINNSIISSIDYLGEEIYQGFDKIITD